MDNGNKEDWEDQEWRNNNNGRCGQHKWENKRSDTEMVGPCGDKDWRRCSNENIEYGSGSTPKDKKTETEVEWCYKKRHEEETSKCRRSTRSENVEIENSMRLPQTGKWLNKKKLGIRQTDSQILTQTRMHIRTKRINIFEHTICTDLLSPSTRALLYF